MCIFSKNGVNPFEFLLYAAGRRPRSLPDLLQGLNQMLDVLVAMVWRGGQAQAFRTLGDRRVIDRLHIYAVLLQKPVSNRPAEGRIAHQDGDDM